MPVDIRFAIVQIRHVQHGALVGTGFLVAADLVLTCAHVVESASAGAGDELAVTFHLNGERRMARVLSEAWRPATADDVAFLQLTEAAPGNAVPLELTEVAGCDGHAFRAFGYPRLGTVEGAWAAGAVRGLVRQSDGRALLQLTSAELDQGLSGSPVFDMQRERVVGMVTEVYYPDRSTRHRDTALATPADVLHSIRPAVQLHPAPLRELFSVDGRFSARQLLRRNTLRLLVLRLRRQTAARPVQAILAAGVLIALVLLALSALRSYQQRDWRSISGGNAILGAPDRTCSVPAEPFEIQTFEVTNAQYLTCVRADRCAPPRSNWQAGPEGASPPIGLEQHPVYGLRRADAEAYCQFIEARLPTEAEWLRAARGASTATYPWGDTFAADHLNGFESGIGNTVEVTAYPDGRSVDGVWQLSGNVREWIADRANDACDYTKGEGLSIAKGGAFQDDAAFTSLWARFRGDDLPFVGVRCARDRQP